MKRTLSNNFSKINNISLFFYLSKIPICTIRHSSGKKFNLYIVFLIYFAFYWFKEFKLIKWIMFLLFRITLVCDKDFCFLSIPSTLVNLTFLKSVNLSITKKLIMFSQSQHSFHFKRCFSNACGYLQFGKLCYTEFSTRSLWIFDFHIVCVICRCSNFKKPRLFLNSIESIPTFQNWFVILTPFIMKLSFWNKT